MKKSPTTKVTSNTATSALANGAASRRSFMKAGCAAVGGLILARPLKALAAGGQGKATVLFTPVISQESLVAIYEALNHPLKGKVGVKISTGEPGGHNFLNPQLIAPLVKRLDGTIIECCTAYKGRRLDPKEHWKAIKEHGFLDIAPCDILDEEGEMPLPVEGGFHLKENWVGANLPKYDSILMLQHFKGHAMAGFGGALKNMSIGLASTSGKTWIHTAGVTRKWQELFDKLAPQDHFLESMADACSAVMAWRGRENIVYVSVANNLSVDCDCSSHPSPPKMADLGIFASLDPVALDQACHDAVVNAQDEGKADLIKRMRDRNGIHTVEAANQLGLGTREYELVTIGA